MPRNKPSLMPLLRCLARDSDGVGGAAFDEGQLRFVVALGLAPLLQYATRNDREIVPRALRPMIAGADLAGEAAHAKLRAALCEILDASAALPGRITLLKGMSVCRYYPRPHLRPMGDIDLLTSPGTLPGLERILRDLGYRPGEFGMEPGFYDEHHHTCPFMHPETAVRVEVHRRLFPPHCRIPDGSALRNDNVRTQLVSSTFEGREVQRFGAELELVYIAAHWAYDLHLPLVASGLLDTLCLLRAESRDMDWDRVFSWLHAREIATPLAVLLGYLVRHDLLDLDAATAVRLRRAPKSVGRLGERTMHEIVDRCLDGSFFDGLADRSELLEIVWRTLASPGLPLANLYTVPRNVAFPPHHPDRFRPRFQLRRLQSMVGWKKGVGDSTDRGI